MTPEISILALFILITLGYWILLTRSGFFSDRYYLELLFLFGGGMLGLAFLARYQPPPGDSTGWYVILVAFVALFAILSSLLGLAKLFLLQGDRPRRLKSLERSSARFNAPTRRVKIRTEDNVRIQVVHLVGETPRDKVVISCHGGGRHKDIYAAVATCEYLFQDYDVITFDFRGHRESGGVWRGDGSAGLDVKAVIDYARQQGYQRVGVVGWSLGAWAAVIAAAEFQGMDALVAAAPPPTDFRDVGLTKPLMDWGYKPWAFPLRVLIRFARGLNIGRPESFPSLMDYVEKVAPVPLLIVCNTYDRVIGMPEGRFRELFERANEPKDFFVIDAPGHIYDWPSTITYLLQLRKWLGEML